MSRKKLGKITGYIIGGLPVLGMMGAAFMPISARTQQLLVLVALIWFQVFLILEVFLFGK
jgi:hypothetical protein